MKIKFAHHTVYSLQHNLKSSIDYSFPCKVDGYSVDNKIVTWPGKFTITELNKSKEVNEIFSGSSRIKM